MSVARTIAIRTAIVLGLSGPVIGYYEGMVPHTYADPVGIPTICYGHTGPDVEWGDTRTAEQCEALKQSDMQAALGGVLRCTGPELADHEYAALVSFTYNVGTTAYCNSTMARQINAGAPATVWCSQLDRWVYAKGIKLPGLIKRRAAERALCEGRA